MRNGSGVKSPDCSCRESKFSSHHASYLVHNALLPQIQSDLSLFTGFCGQVHFMHVKIKYFTGQASCSFLSIFHLDQIGGPKTLPPNRFPVSQKVCSIQGHRWSAQTKGKVLLVYNSICNSGNLCLWN